MTSTNWNPGVAFPILNTTYTVGDLLDGLDGTDSIKTDADDVLLIVIQQHLLTQQLDPVFTMPDIPFIALDSTNFFNVPLSQEEKIYGLTYSNGNLNGRIVSTQTEDVTVKVILPYTRLNSVPWEKTYNLTYSGSKMALDINEDLTGYTMDFTADGTTESAMAINYEARLTASNAPIMLDSLYGVIDTITYSLVTGYFGQQDFERITGGTALDVIEGDLLPGSYTFHDPRLIMYVSHNMGVPIHIDVDTFMTIKDGTPSFLTGSVFQNGVDLKEPLLVDAGDTVTTIITINDQVSNIGSLLSDLPDSLYYAMAGTVNPDDDSTLTNFTLDQSEFNVDLDIEIPFTVSIQGLTFQDTVEMDFSSLDFVSDVVYKIVTTSRLPAQLDLQVYFLDSNQVVMDSIFDGGILTFLAAGIVDGNGFVTDGVKTDIEAVVDQQRMEAVKSAKFIAFDAVLTTAGNGTIPVKFRITDGFDLQIGIQAGVDVNTTGEEGGTNE